MDTKSIFAKRFRELREAAGLKQSEMGEKLGVSRGSISFYENCDRNPDIEFIANAAQYFKVSSDYLLGLTDTPTTDPYRRAAFDSLGLSYEAVDYLMMLNQVEKENHFGPSYVERRDLLSYFLSLHREIDDFLTQCSLYVSKSLKGHDPRFTYTNEYIMCMDTLKAHGFSISANEEQTRYLFNERIVPILRGLLDSYVDMNRRVHSAQH